MGCCLSSGQEEEKADLEDLRRRVEGLTTKEEREKMILHHLTLFEEAESGSRGQALATLAFVICFVDNSK